MTAGADDDEREDIEIDVLLEAVQRRYAYDFRGYARASLRRRLWRRAAGESVATISGLQERVLHDPDTMERLLRDLSINVTEMFRDPTFHRAIREQVFPLLRTYPYIRVWNAGCSTGEELYSVAIALHEAGLLDRARLYATDINDDVLARARDGAFPIEHMQRYTENYLRAGGKGEFSAYYTTRGNHAHFDPALARHAVFAQHNLVSDRSFNEFNLIICRNVMIYFGRDLQDRVHSLFLESLSPFGVLALGRKESLKGTVAEPAYEPLNRSERIYKRREG